MTRAIRSITRSLAVLVVLLLAMPGVASAQQTSTYIAGSTTVTYSDSWKLEPEFSPLSGVFLKHLSLKATAFGYVESNEFGTSDVEGLLEAFAVEFEGSFDAGSMHVVASGTAGSTTGWRLYVATTSGVPIALMITANTAAQVGVPQLSMLLSPVGSFDLAFEDARTGIQLDGLPSAASTLDLQQLLAALENDSNAAFDVPIQGGGTEPSSTAAGQLSTSTPAVVDGIDYRALDAPAGCDRIGWAITDPNQQPSTEAEIDHRASCTGGVSYVAQCGTVDGERADTRYITCKVTALVTDGPQEFAFDMFELVQADGSSEYIDFGMSFGNDTLFSSGEVPEGATASGTAPFAIDADAAEPLLLSIQPPSLPSGAEPAVLVIEGPLQDFAAFEG
jgi:hypothetical protein